MANPNRPSRAAEPRRRRQFQRRYGISVEVYDQMVLDQGGRCLICKRKKRLCVDHDHESGVVRGLLCHRCNSGLGYFAENPVLLKRAIGYLMRGV